MWGIEAPVYIYDDIDQRLIEERVAQFRDQTDRFLRGVLSEDDFRPLRLQNGLYIQRHAPMLRIAIPYGLLSSRQLRALAHVTRKYDRGTVHPQCNGTRRGHPIQCTVQLPHPGGAQTDCGRDGARLRFHRRPMGDVVVGPGRHHSRQRRLGQPQRLQQCL